MAAFKFDFDVEDIDEDNEIIAVIASTSDSALSSHGAAQETPSTELPLSELLDALPDSISFSPVHIPLSSSSAGNGGEEKINLARRDLFDARFQLIAQDSIQEDVRGPEDKESVVAHNALGFIDAPSDLVPGVYEGGLKTWECSLDLVEYLHHSKGEELSSWLEGKRVLEIGCGTAVPSLYLLHALFNAVPPEGGSPRQETEIHLQDYNRSVLELVTLPNLILAWYMSSASASYRTTAPPSQNEDADADADVLPPADASLSGDLPLTPELKAAFLSSLSLASIRLKFFAGSWSDLHPAGRPFDIVLTSETIYRPDTVGVLIDLIRRTCLPSQEDALADLRLSESEHGANSARSPATCLIAAKVFYFGVGGGISDFVEWVESALPARAETVWERKTGVTRRVLELKWL